MSTGGNKLDELQREYQAFAERVQKLLWDNPEWQERYAEYAKELLKNEKLVFDGYKTLGGQKVLEPLHCYTKIGAILDNQSASFDLRYLGQSVGTIRVKDGVPKLTVDKGTSESNQKHFCYGVKIIGEDWPNGSEGKAFRKHYQGLVGKVPRQPEHMVESALFSEFEKEQGVNKVLEGIQPITFKNADGLRLHMKTALAASKSAKSKSCDPTISNEGGEIDIFCRHGERGIQGESRLTVIEVKYKSGSFPLVIRQAIAYAVFIRELARSECGRDWMELWGMGNQPWEKGFTINAVAAMPDRKKANLSFAETERLELKGKNPNDATDYIELHYIAFCDDPLPRDGESIRFKTSLSKETSCQT